MSDYLMQAASSVDGQLHTWTSATPDFAGSGYPGGGSPTDVVVSVAPAASSGATPGGSDGDLQRNASGALAPVRTDANGAPAEGDIARYDGDKWIAADDVAELPDTLTVGDLFYWNGSAIAAIPAGTEGQVLTMVSGVPAWADGGGGGGGFDPATLDLTGWWRASYTGTPWAGTASAGTSASHSLINGSAPATGTSVNSLVPASFNGSSHYLVGDDLEDLFTTTAYTIVVLVKPTGGASPAGNVYDNDHILACTPYGLFGIAWSTSGVKAWHAEAGPIYKETDWIACSADAWVMVAVTFNGSSLSLDLNQSGSPETVATTSVQITGLGSLPLRVGLNYASNYMAMDTLEVMTADTALSGTDLDNVKDYFNTTYGLTL